MQKNKFKKTDERVEGVTNKKIEALNRYFGQPQKKLTCLDLDFWA